jgi:hypothetical protein
MLFGTALIVASVALILIKDKADDPKPSAELHLPGKEKAQGLKVSA